MIVRCCRALLILLCLSLSALLAAAGDSFPFGRTLMLDTTPMRGSKRIPMLEIAENGAASIDLWCASARAQAIVADNAISISPGDLQNTQCGPDGQTIFLNSSSVESAAGSHPKIRRRRRDVANL